jgi:hypothetical protein
MAFKPVERYEVALPTLKAGHIIHVGPDFDKGYVQVITVRHNRKKVAISGAKTTLYDLTISTDSSFESLHGNLKKNRIVHLRYLGVDTNGVTTNLWWLTQPLQSKDVEESISTDTAKYDTSPITIDRWSYDDSQYLRLKQTGTQNYYIDIAEYEVVEYPAKPKEFLHIFANGQAQFVTEGTPVAGLGNYERQALRELEKIRAMRRVE